MNEKKWLLLWIINSIIIVLGLIIVLRVFQIPLRFSNSISYDAKLNFIKNTELLKSADTVVVGSSMALNNINGVYLEENGQHIKQVANIASWGLQSSEVLQLVQLINLQKIKYVIYSTQYIDFNKYVLKSINENEVKKFIDNEFSIYPYFNTLMTLNGNILRYLNYKKLYFNKKSYKYLNFDKTGSINLDFGKKYIDMTRWDTNRKLKYKLDIKCFESLISLSILAKENNITLIVLTTPYRKSVLEKNKVLSKIFYKYISILKKLSEKYNFIYLNAHNILNLSDAYFVDKEHLNKQGSKILSQAILKNCKL